MEFHFATLVMACTGIALVLSLVHISVYLRFRRTLPGIGLVVLGTSTEMVGLALLGVPHTELALLSGNLLTLAAQALYWLGLRRMRGQPWQVGPIVVPVAINLFCLLAGLVGHAPHDQLHMSLVAGSWVWLSALCLKELLWRTPPELCWSYRSAALPFIAFGGLMAFWLYWGLTAWDYATFMTRAQRMLPINVLVGLFCFVLVAISFFPIIHDHLAAKLRQQANFDSLTGVYNRRMLLRHANRVLMRTIRRHEAFALLMIDADHFKQVNDRYGHQAGDAVLKRIAGLIGDAVRPGDVVGRYGGEEFCVVLAKATLIEAAQVAERIRERVLTTPIEHLGESLRLTLSVGVADYTAGRETVESLIHDADQALFSAKAAGRNRVITASSPQAHASNRLLAAEIEAATQGQP